MGHHGTRLKKREKKEKRDCYRDGFDPENQNRSSHQEVVTQTVA